MVAGTVNGKVFAAIDAILLPATPNTDLAILITDRSGITCDTASGSFLPKANSLVLAFTFKTSVQAAVPGTYPLFTGDGVTAFLSAIDAQCMQTVDSPDFPTSGTITITTASAASVSGSVDLTFASGSLHGTFAAPVCVSLDGGQVCAP